MRQASLVTTYPPFDVRSALRGAFLQLIQPQALCGFFERGSIDPQLLLGRSHFYDLTDNVRVPEFCGNSYLLHLGRGAVYLAGRALALNCRCGGPHSVAVPSYHCGSEIEALLRAGLKPNFYRVKPDLTVDCESFYESSCRSCVCYVVSFFGFPPIVEGIWPPPENSRVESGSDSDARDGVRLDELGTEQGGVFGGGATRLGMVIEDAAQALYSKYPDGSAIGSKGTAAIFSIRKSLGTLDGGALWLYGKVGAAAAPLGRARTFSVANARTLASQLLLSIAGGDRWIATVAARAVSQLSRSEKAALDGELSRAIFAVDENEGAWTISESALASAASRAALLSYFVLAGQWPSAVAAARRGNYTRLVWEFDLGEFVPEGLHELPPGTVPLFLPVECPDRRAAVAAFFERGVRVVEVWPVPHRSTPEQFISDTRAARERLLGIPVHQGLSGSALEMVGEVAAEILRR